jgi:hypothetical protein
MKTREKPAMHMVDNRRGETFTTTSGVGHIVWAEAEAAFSWPSFLPTVTTRLAQPPHNPSNKAIFGVMHAKASSL